LRTKKQKLEFKTKRNAEIAKQKKYFLIFCAFLLVFAGVSMFVFLRSIDFDFGNLFDGRSEETTVAESTAVPLPVLTGSANFLVYCVSDDAKDPDYFRFIAVINADLSRLRLRVCALSPISLAAVHGSQSTRTEHFTAVDAQRLKEAVESLGGITIDKFAYTTDTGFKNAMKSIDKAGSLKIQIDQAINYKEDKLNLFLPAGNNAMNGETLLKYFRYNATQGEPGLDMQAQTIRSILDYSISAANAQNSETLYEQLYNTMKITDISGFDFNNAKPAIELLAGAKDRLSISVEQNLKLFAGAQTDTTREESTS